MNQILILGGSGFVGRSLCELLVERFGGGGAQIIVPTRHPERAKHLLPLPTLRVVQANVHDDAQLRELTRGCDAVVNLVAILHGSAGQFERVHAELPRRVIAACAAQGVRRVVHISALGASASAPSLYLRSKAAGEKTLMTSGLDCTLLRPSVMFGDHDQFLNLFAKMQRLLPFVPLAGAQARFQPVWVRDVARAIVNALYQPSSIGQTFECAGPEVFTLEQLVQLAGRWSGHERPVIELPESIGRLQALAMEWLPGTPLMSRDNLKSMLVPNVASGSLPGLQNLGVTPATLASVATGYLGAGRGIGRLNGWRARRNR